MQAITNGVHTQTWLGYQMSELSTSYLTPAWRENLMDEMFWKRGVANIPDKELWDVHNMQKENLVRFARGRDARPARPPRLFARRIARPWTNCSTPTP